MDDLFIRNYIEDLLKNIRTKVLLKPYTRIKIHIISMTFSETDGKDGKGNRKEKEGLTMGETSFTWHVEDHDFCSIKYMHMGAGKTRARGSRGNQEILCVAAAATA
ncbi:hypothetical protein Tco_1493344 [Tanacetum coccineum]